MTNNKAKLTAEENNRITKAGDDILTELKKQGAFDYTPIKNATDQEVRFLNAGFHKGFMQGHLFNLASEREKPDGWRDALIEKIRLITNVDSTNDDVFTDQSAREKIADLIAVWPSPPPPVVVTDEQIDALAESRASQTSWCDEFSYSEGMKDFRTLLTTNTNL